MGVAFQCLSCASFVTDGRIQSSPLQRKPLVFSLTLSSRSQNLSTSIVTASSNNKNKNEKEDAFELLFKQLEEDLKSADLSIDVIDHGQTEEDMALLERQLGDFEAILSNLDTAKTPAGNDAEKTSKDGKDDSPNLRTWLSNKLTRALKSARLKTIKNLIHVTKENEEEEDAFEMLFKQLEEDLKNDDLSIDVIDRELTEEDMALLERELEGVLGVFDDELLNSDATGKDAEKSSKDGNDDSLNLRTSIFNILARALKTRRR